MNILLIAAVSENGVIGEKGRIPWHLPEDFKFFKATTMGHPVIMGRKTFESIGRPLPGRTNIIITGNEGYRAPGCVIVHSFDEALYAAGDVPEVFVIGGAQVFREAMPAAQTIYLTKVHTVVEGDVLFPELKEDEWELVSREEFRHDEQNIYDMSFLKYERK